MLSYILLTTFDAGLIWVLLPVRECITVK